MELMEYIDKLETKKESLKRQVKTLKLEIDEAQKEIQYLHTRPKPSLKEPLSILNDEEWELIFRNLEDSPTDLLNICKTSPKFERIVHKRLKQSKIDLQFELVLPKLIPYLSYEDLENCYRALEKPSIPEWRLICLVIAYFLRLSGRYTEYGRAPAWSKFGMPRTFLSFIICELRNQEFVVSGLILLFILYIATMLV